MTCKPVALLLAVAVVLTVRDAPGKNSPPAHVTDWTAYHNTEENHDIDSGHLRLYHVPPGDPVPVVLHRLGEVQISPPEAGNGDTMGGRLGESQLLSPQYSAGQATYYHPSLAGGEMRIGGERYDPANPTIAAVADQSGWPTVDLGTPLEVCHDGTETCIVVTVKDTGVFPAHHLDLSESAFRSLGVPTSRGRIDVKWRTLSTEE